jgi:hypothetical protein
MSTTAGTLRMKSGEKTGEKTIPPVIKSKSK